MNLTLKRIIIFLLYINSEMQILKTRLILWIRVLVEEITVVQLDNNLFFLRATEVHYKVRKSPPLVAILCRRP